MSRPDNGLRFRLDREADAGDAIARYEGAIETSGGDVSLRVTVVADPSAADGLVAEAQVGPDVPADWDADRLTRLRRNAAIMARSAVRGARKD